MFIKTGFGLPPTPPSSLSSDDSEDNQSAEMHTIPSSPASSLSSFSPNSSQSAQQQSKNCQSASNGSPNSARGYNSSSSRQPIHTPLISTQPVCVVFFLFLLLHLFILEQTPIDKFKWQTLYLIIALYLVLLWIFI